MSSEGDDADAIDWIAVMEEFAPVPEDSAVEVGGPEGDSVYARLR